MTWSELDLDAAVWSLPVERVKNGRAWRVPLPPTAVAVLREREARAGGAPLVFADERNSPFKPAALAFAHSEFLKKIGIPFRIHDVRSITCTQAAAMGTAPDVLDAMLNHLDSRSVTRRHYDRYTRESEHRRALLRWDNWLQGNLEPRGEVVPFPSIAVAS
jgi:integrase